MVTKVTWFFRGSGRSGGAQLRTGPLMLSSEFDERIPESDDPPVSRTVSNEGSERNFEAHDIIEKISSPSWKPSLFSTMKPLSITYPHASKPPFSRIIRSIQSMNVDTLVYMSCRSDCNGRTHIIREGCTCMFMVWSPQLLKY